MVMPKKFFFKAGLGSGKQGALSEHGESNFWVCAWNPMEWPFKENLSSSTFTWYYLFSMYSESVDEILWCDHSNETSSAVLSHVTIYLVCSSNLWVCVKSYGLTTQMLPFLFCKTWKMCITWVSVCWHLRAKTISNYSRGMPIAQCLQTPNFKLMFSFLIGQRTNKVGLLFCDCDLWLAYLRLGCPA